MESNNPSSWVRSRFGFFYHRNSMTINNKMFRIHVPEIDIWIDIWIGLSFRVKLKKESQILSLILY